MNLTPEMLDIIPTKDEMNGAIKKSEERIRKDISEVLSAVDGIAKKFETFDQELAANQGAHDRFDKNFSALKKRQLDKVVVVPSMH